MATSKKAAAKAPASNTATAAKKPRAAAAQPRPAARPEAKPAPVAGKAAKTSAVPPAAPDKSDKPKKPKLVRDSFTIPKPEYAVLDDLKDRAARLGRPVKKSEVLRAGVKALAAMADAAFVASLDAVPAVKTGRPAREA